MSDLGASPTIINDIVIPTLSAFIGGLFTLFGVIAAYIFGKRIENKKVKRQKLEVISLKVNKLIFAIAQSSTNNRMLAVNKSVEDGLQYIESVSVAFDTALELSADIDVLLELYFSDLDKRYSSLGDQVVSTLKSFKSYRSAPNLSFKSHTEEYDKLMITIENFKKDIKLEITSLA